MTQTTSLHHLHAATAELDPPLAALDLTALERNAADLVRRANGTAIRVASKSVRCRAVLERVLGDELTARGGFAGIMAYSLREAIWLARLGARDVLLGYPVLDRAGLAELAAAPNLLAAITLMIDDVAQLELTRAALGTDLVHPRVCLDVDAALRIGPLHLGARRSPVRSPEQAGELAAEALRRGFDVVGVMTYESQIAGLPDSNPAVRVVKRLSAIEIGRRRTRVLDAVRAVTGPLEIVNSGGTGSIEVSITGPDRHRGDRRFRSLCADPVRSLPLVHPAPRAVLRHPGPAQTRPEHRHRLRGRLHRVRPRGSQPGARSGLARRAETARLRRRGRGPDPLAGGAELEIGDRVWFRHAKAGELCERFTEIHMVDESGARTTVPTYRGEGQCFG